jgi:hypothetical protein
VNAEECTRLVAMVRTLYPAQRFDESVEGTVRAWGFVVADLSYDEAHAALVRLSRRTVQWVSPGEIRREAARHRNVLAPDVDQLLADVREVAARQGVGRKLLHPAAARAYDGIGGAESIKRLDAYGLQRLRSSIAEQVKQHDERVLEESTLPPPRPALSPVADRIAAVEAHEERRALTSAGAHPQTAAELRRMAEEFGKDKP